MRSGLFLSGICKDARVRLGEAAGQGDDVLLYRRCLPQASHRLRSLRAFPQSVSQAAEHENEHQGWKRVHRSALKAEMYDT